MWLFPKLRSEKMILYQCIASLRSTFLPFLPFTTNTNGTQIKKHNTDVEKHIHIRQIQPPVYQLAYSSDW